MSERNILNNLHWIALAGSLTLSTGCNLAGDHGETPTKVQYMPDMVDGPTVKAQESFMDPPEHSVPVTGILYPDTIEEAQDVFKNPFPPSDENLAKGKELFNTFCIPCHGADARGGGSLGPLAPVPPDITHPTYRERPDGFFFYRITFGKGMMPGYGHAISPGERWQIIHYLRTLQKGE